MQNRIFSERLSVLMKSAGVNQEALASRCGVSQSTISRYLKGTMPRADELLQISKILGVAMEHFFAAEAGVSMVQEQSQTYGKRVSQADVEKVKIEIYRAVEAAFRKLEEQL